MSRPAAEVRSILEQYLSRLPEDVPAPLSLSLEVAALQGDDEIEDVVRDWPAGVEDAEPGSVMWRDVEDLVAVLAGDLLLDAVGYAGRLTAHCSTDARELVLWQMAEPGLDPALAPWAEIAALWRASRDGADRDVRRALDAVGLERIERRRMEAMVQASTLTPRPGRAGTTVRYTWAQDDVSFAVAYDDAGVAHGTWGPGGDAGLELVWLSSTAYLRELAGALTLEQAVMGGLYDIRGDLELAGGADSKNFRFW